MSAWYVYQQTHTSRGISLDLEYYLPLYHAVPYPESSYHLVADTSRCKGAVASHACEQSRQVPL